jgi:hypothetical protein
MSDTPPDRQFWQMVDAMLDTANAQCDQAERTKVAGAVLFAAARFNVFVAAAGAPSADELTARRDAIAAYLTDQFGRMLRDNLDEYAQNFDRYLPPSAH